MGMDRWGRCVHSFTGCINKRGPGQKRQDCWKKNSRERYRRLAKLTTLPVTLLQAVFNFPGDQLLLLLWNCQSQCCFIFLRFFFIVQFIIYFADLSIVQIILQSFYLMRLFQCITFIPYLKWSNSFVQFNNRCWLHVNCCRENKYSSNRFLRKLLQSMQWYNRCFQTVHSI